MKKDILCGKHLFEEASIEHRDSARTRVRGLRSHSKCVHGLGLSGINCNLVGASIDGLLASELIESSRRT